MKTKSSLLLAAALLGPAILSAETRIYTVDPVHSGIDFKIRHFINKVPGTFGSFEGEIHYNPDDASQNKATGIITVKSVDTRNEDRDAHLQNEDFFKSNLHPVIEFRSTEWIPAGENVYTVKGTLTMVGVEKPVSLTVTFLGEMAGNDKIRSGWEGSATIDRTEWGMGYGTPAVGKEVDIELNIQAHRDLVSSVD